jgi:hypothetical protein
MKWLNCDRMKLVVVGIVVAMVLGGGRAKADFVFGKPVNLGPTANTSYKECPSCISADGLELYICSNRPGSVGDYDIWVMTRTTREDDWQPPVHLGPGVNSSVREWTTCVSADGLELYFDAWQRPGGQGGWDIWVSRRQTRNDPWGNAVNLGLPFNSSSWDGSPSLSADGLEFYFGSSRPGGQGHDDLWVAKRATKNDPWGEAVNLGAIVNSSARECGVKISSDSLALFFSGDFIPPFRSGGFGVSDIWMTRRASRDDDWNEPVNLGALVNSTSQDYGPVISHDGDTLYFCSGRPGGYGSYDIYQAPIIPIVDLNGDGIVDSADMVIMVDNWGTDNSLCDIGPMPWGDGIVDVEDLIILAEHLFEEVPLFVVDDFESYTDTPGNIIWDTWMDSYKNNTGASIGYGEPPHAEVQIVHGGKQAMPFFYDNDGTVLEGTVFEKKGTEFYAEAQLQLEIPQNWTRRGDEVLTLWFYGDSGNAVEPFYVALGDNAGNRKEVQHPNPAAVTLERWEQWSIPIADFTGVDATTITIMGIGVGDPASNQPGGSGLLRIDDIELHVPTTP